MTNLWLHVPSIPTLCEGEKKKSVGVSSVFALETALSPSLCGKCSPGFAVTGDHLESFLWLTLGIKWAHIP